MNVDAMVWLGGRARWLDIFLYHPEKARACTEKHMSHGMKRKGSSRKLLSLMYFADKKNLTPEIRFDSCLR